MMKTGRGWWPLAGMVVGSIVLLLGGYVGAYFRLAGEAGYSEHGAYWSAPVYPRCEWIELDWFFRPIHRLDANWIRSELWAVHSWPSAKDSSSLANDQFAPSDTCESTQVGVGELVESLDQPPDAKAYEKAAGPEVPQPVAERDGAQHGRAVERACLRSPKQK
jgi:hypothetical protein